MNQLQQPSGCFSHNSKKQVGTAYILAGGQSRRLGQDKLFVMERGNTLLGHSVQVCSDLFHTVKIVAKHADKFHAFDCDIIIDSSDADGPMAGVIAALQDCNDDWCFITAADLPDLNRDIISIMTERYSGQQFVGLQEQNGPQMLCGIYHVSALPVLLAKAQQGNYSMVEALSALSHTLIPVPVDTWRNINTPDDLKKLE